MTTLAARLATNPGADRIRLRIGTAFLEHVDDLWPQREPNATLGMDPSPCRRNSRVAGAVFLRHDGRECTACRIGFIGCSGCSTISTLINQFSYESFDLRVTAPTPNIFLSASIDLN
jgi:hypothetical protein